MDEFKHFRPTGSGPIRSAFQEWAMSPAETVAFVNKVRPVPHQQSVAAAQAVTQATQFNAAYRQIAEQMAAVSKAIRVTKVAAWQPLIDQQSKAIEKSVLAMMKALPTVPRWVPPNYPYFASLQATLNSAMAWHRIMDGVTPVVSDSLGDDGDRAEREIEQSNADILTRLIVVGFIAFLTACTLDDSTRQMLVGYFRAARLLVDGLPAVNTDPDVRGVLFLFEVYGPLAALVAWLYRRR
jgi:hypothetical protein